MPFRSINKIRIIASNSLILLSFLDLDLSGGSFYEDGLIDYLQVHGKLLKKLSLVHVEEIDKQAFSLITTCCPNLVEFGINNCEVVEGGENQGIKNHNAKNTSFEL